MRSERTHSGALLRAAALFLALVLLAPAAFLTSCGRTAPVAPMDVRILNVGKADCILIETGGHLVVIDTGTKDTALTVADTVRKAGNVVDLLILTHYDKDHIGGVKKMLKKNEVRAVCLPSYEVKEEAAEIKSLIAAEGLEPVIVSKKLTYTFGDAVFTIYPSSITSLEDDDDASNISSLVIHAAHGKNTFLFAGDADKSRLKEVLDQLGSKANVDFLKVPHHGKQCGKSDKFFETTRPGYAVICCSKSDPADDAVVAKLEKIGAEVFFTYNGTVSVSSDGKTIAVTQ